MEPIAKVTATTTSSIYKLLIVCFLAVFLAACDDDKDDNKPATYTVTFNTNGGTPATIDTQTVKSGDKAPEPDEKPTKGDTLVFSHWETEGGTTYDFSAPVRTNLALKAVYAKAYKVTFDTDDGTPNVDDQIIAHGSQAQEPDEKPTKGDTLVFSHWETEGGTTYDFSTPVTADLALKAAYAINTYSVTFDTDGGMPEIETQTIVSGSPAQEPDVKPTKLDSVAIGWLNTANNQVYDFSTPVTSDLSLKANYSKTYKVTFDTDGGTPASVEPQTVKSGEQAQQPTVKPTKGELVLKNWINTATSQPYSFFTPVRADLTLKAEYANVYTVRFETNGGSTIDDKKVLDGETVAAPIPPTKTDAFFAGWHTDDMFTTPYNFTAPVTASDTLYARWSDYNIPDDRFRAYLKGQVPNAFDGEQLQPDHQEVKELKTIGVGALGIVSLEGIQYFTGLTTLLCYSNRLSSLDIANNTALTRLDCYSNQLSSLDVSKNTALRTLDCNSNQLSSLDVSKNTALTILYCSSNQLSSLDVSKNTALRTLDCYSNQLSSLDVSSNMALKQLSCSSNQLTSLDVANNTALETLQCSSNQLTSLDVANNTALTTLSCYSNQLTSLDVANNTALTTLSCSSNQLTSLDVANNTALTTLSCSSNQLTSLNMKANKNLTRLLIHFVNNGEVFPNEKLAEILVHKSKLCDAGITFGSGIKGIFEANKETLEMTITSYDDDGNETTYDEAAYAAACPNE